MRFFTFLVLLLAAFPAHAEEGGTFFGYNLGVTYVIGTSYAQISYDAPTQAQMPQDCAPDNAFQGKMLCTAYLAPDTSDATGFSIYLEAPFKRQGLFYFEPGLTLSTLSYKGTLASNPAPNPATAVRGGPPGAPPEQPLTHALMELYGIDWQGYLRVGLTPRYLPDLFLSGGLGLQTVGGRFKIFTEDGFRFVVQPDAFAELEAVFVRFKTGYLSAFLGQDVSLLGTGTQVTGDDPSGTNLTNFHVQLQTASSGIRVLFPF